MKTAFTVALIAFCFLSLRANESLTTASVPDILPILTLEDLVQETLEHNPEIKAAFHEIEVSEGRLRQAGTLDDPELRYTRMDMPDFRYNEAMRSRLDLMQMIRFPSKLTTESDVAEVRVSRSRTRHLEKVNEVIASLKAVYVELWNVQQTILLTQENAGLLDQFARIAQTKYSVGNATQQDVLKAYVELAKIDNQLIDLRQKELSAKAMLMAILNRAPGDTLGTATLPDSIVFNTRLENLVHHAVSVRPMLLQDSLMVVEENEMLSMARQEYLPDLRLGLEYVTGPVDGFRGWSVMAGITLPFAPWTLGKAGGRVEEAQAALNSSKATYAASRNMVAAQVSDLYFKVVANRQQWETYRNAIIPQADQSLRASMTAYQTGSTDFLMLIDAYRTLVDLEMESLMVRMRYEQMLAELERAVGSRDIAQLQ